MALGVGLLLGLALVRSNAPSAATDSMVSSLQQSFDAISGENTRLTQDLSQADSLNQTLFDSWVPGRLSGQKVVVLAGHDDQESARQVVSATKAAGGQALVASFSLPDEQNSKALSELADALAGAGVDIGTDADEQQVRSAVCEAFALEWASAAEWPTVSLSSAASSSLDRPGSDASSLDGEVARTLGGRAVSSSGDVFGAAFSQDSDASAPASNSDFQQDYPVSFLLEQRGLLAIDGGVQQALGADRFVDVATLAGEPDSNCLELLAALQRAGGVAVAAQTGQDQTGVVGAARDEKISGTGSLGELSGNFTLISLLSGDGEPGIYSVEGAQDWPAPAPHAPSSSADVPRASAMPDSSASDNVASDNVATGDDTAGDAAALASFSSVDMGTGR